MRRNHRHPSGGPSRLDGGDQVCEGLAGAGGGLDHLLVSRSAKGMTHEPGHLGLLGARLPPASH